MATEREIILAWLRSDTDNVDPIGGDNYVAWVIANDIEAGAHLRWAREHGIDVSGAEPAPRSPGHLE